MSRGWASPPSLHKSFFALLKYPRAIISRLRILCMHLVSVVCSFKTVWTTVKRDISSMQLQCKHQASLQMRGSVSITTSLLQVTVNEQPIFEATDMLPYFICAAYRGEKPKACSNPPKQQSWNMLWCHIDCVNYILFLLEFRKHSQCNLIDMFWHQ